MKLSIKILFSIMVLTSALFALIACAPASTGDVVKAFNAVKAEGVITQTAVENGAKYSVTVITSDKVTVYTVGEDFNIEGEKNASDEAADSAVSPLESAYKKAFELSGIAPEEVIGFDFDKDTYMGMDVYKVEIEEVGAKYKYIFKAGDMSLINSEIEFENSLPLGSYISEDAAEKIALEAAGASKSASDIVVRSTFEGGVKEYRVSFNFDGYRYDVDINAVSGRIIKFSKSALENSNLPNISHNITAQRAKEIALEFVFGNEVGEHTFRKVKLDYEDGKFIYEVELIALDTEYEFEISASGDILDVEIDNYESRELPQDKQFITREQAIDAVKKIAGNDIYVIKIEIECEKGTAKRYYYEVEIKKNGVEYGYIVDALTGVATLREGVSVDTALTEEDALEIALKTFDLTLSEITSKRIKLEREDGILCFEVKLHVGSTEYKATVDAQNGNVLEREIEQDEPIVPTDIITRDEAINLVKQRAGDSATVIEADFGYENGRYVYEIEVRVNGVEYDYYVDALTGEVSRNENFVDGGSVTLTEDEALDIAFEFFKVRRSDAKIHKVKLERDDGRLCYEIEFFIKSLKYEIEIDAETGKVLDSERSYD